MIPKSSRLIGQVLTLISDIEDSGVAKQTRKWRQNKIRHRFYDY